MNIFKILANGDGTINEPNISAFIGYLLDPYQDHGLGFEFLKRFLRFVDNNQDFYSYDYEIELEQAFREGDKSKQIVDIVIACFPNQRKSLKESITISSVQNTRAVKKIYLIENKVTYNAKKEGQLKNQFTSTVESLNISPDLVFPIYLTPDIEVYHKEFSNLDENKKRHFVWINESELPHYELSEDEFNDDYSQIDDTNPNRVEKSIYRILKDLIEDESKGNIEAINEYTRHTLVSFVKFIENSFKSEIQEKKEKRIHSGEYTLVYLEKNIKFDIENKLNLLKTELLKRNPLLIDRISNADLSIATEPRLVVSCNGIIIQIFTKAAKGTVKLLYRINKNDRKESLLKLQEVAEKLDIEIKEKNSNTAYTWTLKMKKDKFDITNFDEISDCLIEVMDQISFLNLTSYTQ